MKALAVVFCAVTALANLGTASETLDRARQMERAGDATGARTALARAAQEKPQDPTALLEYARFLDRYADPEARTVYQHLLVVLRQGGDQAQTQAVARRLTLLDLMAGDRQAAQQHLREYHAAGGRDWPDGGAWQDPKADSPAAHYVNIPGPLRSFERMAAISRDSLPEEILPALARNVVTNGYQASHSNDALEQTEYLKLVHRYLSQARELDKLAGPSKIIKIPTCDSAEAGELLRVLGFRMRGGCGSDVVLETVNATRAFLTTDSGFPLPELEQALRTDHPFTYDYHPARVPVLYGPEYWITPRDKEAGGEFIDVFLADPSMCRLYLGLSKLDRGTAESLRKAVTLQRLKAYAHVLDFFGSMFEIRGGKALVPGGPRAEAVWGELAGAPPRDGPAFLEKLLMRDDGWLASYYDALARVHGPVQAYLTEPARLKRFYLALRGHVTSPGPARPVFRSNGDLMLLTTRMWLDADGRPHVPGNLETWRNLFVNHPHGKYDSKLAKSAAAWKDPDDVLEALFGLCRKAVENEPLKIYMALSDVDRERRQPLAPETVARLARDFRDFGNQYAIFTEDPSLSDKSILMFLDTAADLNKIHDPALRADTAGTLQALVGLWQIFTRQGGLPMAGADAAFASVVQPFAAIKGNRELFDAGRNGVKVLLAATGSKPGAALQDRMLDLLAGAASSSDMDSQTQVVEEMTRILEAQRIVSLDTLMQLADHLDAVARGEKLNTALVGRLASRIGEIQLPRASLSSVEKNTVSFGFWAEKHIETQRKLNLRQVVEKAGGDKQKLEEVRGLLAPVLRDTLVAYNYVHYAPPGAQVLYTNPLFVRSHDFIGVMGTNHMWRTTEVFGSGWPSNGGGRLVGSLEGLPYALAEAEQNFLVPTQTQALIWGDLVPQLILSATVPRWWNVTPAQLHWVALDMRYAEAVLAEAAVDPKIRAQAMEALSLQASPARTVQIGALLEQGNVRTALERVTPSEVFALGLAFADRKLEDPGPCVEEMRRLETEVPQQVSFAAISHAFGTPKPTLANSYRSELLNLRTFPTLMGYSSRILAESWESNTLYWAALADETHVAPSQLNVLIPEWTQKLVESIFASHLEDWPAVLRSLHTVGDDVRARARTRSAEQKASLQ